MSVNTYCSFWRSLCGYGQSEKISGATKANVVVRIPRRVIQIRCECPSVGGVIPIATTEEGVSRFDWSFPLFIIRSLQPRSMQLTFDQFHLTAPHLPDIV